jgi:hypothetical protein
MLQRCLVAHGVKMIMQVLIKWSAWPESLSTWEDLEAIKWRFPDVPAWGQTAAQEEGGVTTAQDTQHGAKEGTELLGWGKSSRARKPIVRVNGPEWVSP